MHRIVKIFRPRNNFVVIRGIRIHADNHLRPIGIAIIPSRIAFADPCCSAVDRVHVHGGMHRRKRFAEANVLRNCVVVDLIHEIGAPVPLQTRRIKGVEHALQGWVWQRTHKIQRGLFECPDWFECFFRFLQWPGVCPDDSAHFFHVQMFGEWRSRRHGKKGEEAIQIIGRRRDQIAIPFHHVSRLAQFIEHRARIKRVDRMQPEREGCDDAKIAAAAAKRPEQIGIFVGARFYKFAVGQDHIDREQIIDAQSAFSGEMTDAAAQGQSADASCRNDSAWRSESERVGGVINVAPDASAADCHNARHGIDTRVFDRR